MSDGVHGHLAKAELALAAGRHLLAGGFTEQAGREAYMAAFHAAMAYLEAHTGKQPKTHGGTHSEFARVARSNGDLDPDLVPFLGRAYVLKTISDYDTRPPLASDQAATALATAAEFLDQIRSRVLNTPQ